MQCDGEIELLTRYVRGVVTGPRARLDAVDEKTVESLRREPLHAWLLKLARAGCKVRGSRGNTVREVLDLLEQVMNQTGVTKQELARRSGVSRQRITEIFGPNESRPMLETIVRIAVGLGFPLEVVAERGEQLDDGPTDAKEAKDKSTDARDGSTGAQDDPTGAQDEPGWRNAGAFGAAVLGGSLFPLLGNGGSMAYVGGGVVGAAVVGLGFTLERPSSRHAAFFIGAGIFAGTLVAGLSRALRTPTGAARGGSHAG